MPPTHFRFVSIQQALDDHRSLAADKEYPGYASLLPIVTGDAYEVAIHLDVPPGHRSPVREIVYERWVTILDLGLCEIDDERWPNLDWPAIDALFGERLTSAFGVPILRPLRHDPPPLDVD